MKLEESRKEFGRTLKEKLQAKEQLRKKAEEQAERPSWREPVLS